MGDEYRENEDGKRLDSLKKGLVFLFSYKNMNMEKVEIYKIKKGKGLGEQKWRIYGVGCF